MSEAGEERRLTTILAADVVGYSRLMAADEAGTLASLKALRRELIEPKTAEHHGRVVKLIGDGTLMEFGSVVDAVRFAVDVQRTMADSSVLASLTRGPCPAPDPIIRRLSPGHPPRNGQDVGPGSRNPPHSREARRLVER